MGLLILSKNEKKQNQKNMETQFEKITIQATINAPLQKVWELWTTPAHIMQWNAASEDWHTPKSTNDLKVGGTSFCRMEAKDGSMGFDFKWIYTAVETNKHLAYTLEDDRKVVVDFAEADGKVTIVQTFDAEKQNPVEMQQFGWQSILNNFKKYAEN
jgi:uncharacterized protein YndB with AHSA1/START domain